MPVAGCFNPLAFTALAEASATTDAGFCVAVVVMEAARGMDDDALVASEETLRVSSTEVKSALRGAGLKED